MIFVTVGTAQQPFNRLVKVIDDFAAQTDEKVLIQAGTTTYEPVHAKYFRWATFKDMEKYTHESRIVVSQASAGAIILAIKFRKPIIIVPRLSKYLEHYNDHQYQLALALQNSGQAVVLAEDICVAKLKDAIDRAPHEEAIQSSRESLINGLRRQLNAWQGQMNPKGSEWLETSARFMARTDQTQGKRLKLHR